MIDRFNESPHACAAAGERADSDLESDLSDSEQDASSVSDQDVPELRYIGEERDRDREAMYERRLKLVNQNQVQASLHFIRRMDLFMKYLVRHQPLLCGKLTDYVIRYETQGRGSVHAHMLWWIDLNEEYMRDVDRVAIGQAELRELNLLPRPSTDRDVPSEPLYNQTYLDYTNANLWALSDASNVRQRLDIGVDMGAMRYAVLAVCVYH